MKVLCKSKDGGPDSKVSGFWLIESKRFGSIVLLCFDQGSREVFHTHAFNAVSWVLKGKLREVLLDGYEYFLSPSIKPVITPRQRLHRVFGVAAKTYVLSFRGPWVDVWQEYFPTERRGIKLTHGRKEI